MIRLLDVTQTDSGDGGQKEALPYLPRSQNDLSPEKYRDHMSWAEKEYFEVAYTIAGQNKSLLASRLKINRDTILERFRALGIDAPEPGPFNSR